jgi:serine/threonine-protein phosphatase 2A regulatory subunit B''
VYSSATADKLARTGVTLDQLTSLWVRMGKQNHDEAAQFVYLLTRGARRYLVPEDFVPLIQDIVDSHPGLGFLKEATEFHSRYVHTVIARIFFSVNR